MLASEMKYSISSTVQCMRWFLVLICVLFILFQGVSYVYATCTPKTHLSRHSIQAGHPVHVRCSCSSSKNQTFILSSKFVGLRAVPRTQIQLHSVGSFAWNVWSSSVGTWELKCCLRHTSTCSLRPQSLWVRPAFPDSIQLNFPKQKIWYRIGQKIPFELSVYDKWRNSIPFVRSRWSIKRAKASSLNAISRSPWSFWNISERVPDSTLQIEGQKLILSSEGTFRVSVQVPIHTGEKKVPKMLTAHKTLRIDAKPPHIRLFAFPRGSRIVGRDFLSIRGRAWDTTSGIQYVKIGQKVIKLSKNGYFSTRIPCSKGLQLLSVVARDRAGYETRKQRSFMCFPQASVGVRPVYSQPSTYIRLSQRALDDGQRTSLDDIASIVQYTLRKMPIDPLIPKRIVKGTFGLTRWGPFMAYRVEKSGAIRLRDIRLGIRLQKSAFALRVQLFGVVLPLSIRAGVLRQNIRVLAPVLSFSIRLGLKLERGRVQLRVKHISNDASTLQIQGLSGAIGWLRGIIEKSVRTRLQKGMANMLRTSAFPVLRRLLSSFKFKSTWKIPSQGPHVTRPLLWTSQFSHIQLTPSALSIAVKTHIRSSFSKRIFRPFFPVRSFQWPISGFAGACSFRVINQFLFALWDAGVLRHDWTRALQQSMKKLPDLPIKLPKPSVSVRLTLPPVWMPGRDAFSFRLALGGLFFRVQLKFPDGKTWDVAGYLHVVTSFKMLVERKRWTFLLDAQFDTFSIEFTQFSGMKGGSKARAERGIGQAIRTLFPLLMRAMMRRLPLSSVQTIQLPLPARLWVPKIKIEPRYWMHQGGFMLLGFDLRK